MNKTSLIILSGISGSGKSTALKTFEDLGYFGVDNLPAPLIEHFADFIEGVTYRDCKNGLESSSDNLHNEKFALLIHCREEGFFERLSKTINRLKKNGAEVTLIFLDCRDEVIIRRFKETRRPHPLLSDGPSGQTIAEALAEERALLYDVRETADRVINTSAFSPHELRRELENYVCTDPDKVRKLELTVLSFGFKYGVPVNADLVMDVRFMANPHFVPELRTLDGSVAKVRDYVFEKPEAREFLQRYEDLLQFLIPKYHREGKQYLTIGIGCTGGKHRSVAVANALAERLIGLDASVVVRHRDIELEVP